MTIKELASVELPHTTRSEVAILEPGNKVLYELVNGPIGTGIIAYYGVEVPYPILEERYKAGYHGFDRIHEWHPATTKEVAREQEIQIAATMMQDTAQKSNIPLDQIACLAFSTTCPRHPDKYGRFLAEKAGLPENTLVLEANAGCAGSAIVLNMLFNAYKKYPELKGRPAMWMAIEPGRQSLLGRENPQEQLEVADTFSLAILGNAAAAMIFFPYESLSPIISKIDTKDDVNGGIRGKIDYEVDPSGPILQESTDGKTIRVLVRPDPQGKSIAMNPLEITKRMTPFAGEENWRPLIDQHTELRKQKEIEDQDIALVISHQPSFKLLYGVANHANILNKIRSPFILKDGNISSVALIAATIKLQQAQELIGRDVLMSSYGAGLAIGSLITRVGPLPF